MLQNELESVKYCQATLNQLSKALTENISAGTFSVPGGHKLYREAKHVIGQSYWQVPRKGVKVRGMGSTGSLQDRVKGGSPEKSESTALAVGNKRAWQ